METSPFIYVIVAVVALTFGAFVFLLFPAATRGPAQSVADVDAPRGTVQRSFRESVAAAAPRGYIGWIERQIVHAGRPNGWSVTGIIVWKLVLGVVGILFAALLLRALGFQPLVVVLAISAVFLLFFAPDVIVNSRAHDRQQAITLALPDTLDQMTIAVEAGLGFDSAMAKAARGGTGPLALELIRVLQDMSLGRTRRDAFRELERRTRSEDLRRFVRAVIQADAHGVAIADVLRVQAGEMRLKRRQRAEEQAQKVAVKILFPLIFCLLPVMFIVILTPALLNIIASFAR